MTYLCIKSCVICYNSKKVIAIDIFDYIKSQKSKSFENKSFEETKEDLEELYKYNIIFEELEKGTLFDPEVSMHIKNNEFIQTRLLISEIREKQEIKNRLNSLGYSVGWLKAAVLIKDRNIANKSIESIIKNDYSSISIIVSELNSLKSRIDELESLHISLLKGGLSLDTKTLLEQDFKENHKKLNELYNKQKNILLNLGNIFAELAKDAVRKKK